MEKLIFKKARVKNFLSYGNEWQTIHFQQGMTLVQGFNVDTGKSNGSGKSSITEIIPFALYGKIIKDVPQTDIPNWNNRSGCVVELYFSSGNSEFKFVRGLRPNKFKVYKDNSEIVRAADIRAFQYQMETEVIGIDFKTFKNLVYFSPNNTISILNAKKEQKRQFLESLFDLSEYSDMLKKTNEKIKSLTDKNKEIEITISHTNQTIDMLEKDINDNHGIDTSMEEVRINKLKQELAMFDAVEFDTTEIDCIDDLKKHLESLKDDKSSMQSRISELKTSIKHLEDDINNTDIEEQKKKRDVIDAKIAETQALIDSMESVDDLGDTLIELKEVIENYAYEKDELDKEIADIEKQIEVLKYAISIHKDNIETIEGRKNNMDGKSVCDFCGSEVSPDKLEHHFNSEINEERKDAQQKSKQIDDLTEKLYLVQLNRKEMTELIKKIGEDWKDAKKKIGEREELEKSLERLKESLNLLQDIDKIKIAIAEKTVNLSTKKEELEEVQFKFDMNNDDIELKSDKIKRLEERKDKYDKHLQKIKDLESSLKSAEEGLEKLRELEREQTISLDKKKKEIESKKADLVQFDKDITKNNMLLDHLGYIRVSLKDENVKQFAISALLPYLNKRANHYLSKSGFPYIVSINGWLDASIRGMGTDDVNYKSLSGGESKAMDMAVQLACNDIAELQAKTILGISLYDEILDTSLDADGIGKVMDIVKVKQQETNNSVLIITHKDEVKSFDFDNYIMVEKKDGFSVIQ